MTPSVYTHGAPRNPPHLPGSLPPLPRPRAFEAELVRAERQRRGVYASAAVHRHLAGLPDRIPKGTRASPVRGGFVAHEGAAAISRAIAGDWGQHEGSAVELLSELLRRGYLQRMIRVPNRITAGLALSMLARLTPLVEKISHGRYRIHGGRPASLPESILASLMNERFDHASTLSAAPESSVQPAGSIASAFGADPDPLSAVPVGNSERARGRSPGASSSDGVQLWLLSDYPGAAAGPDFAPAEEPRARPCRSPARAAPVPTSWTGSAWLQAVPMRPVLQRAAALVREHLTGTEHPGTAATLALWLARFEPRASWRSRASLARALESLRWRGLLLADGDVWRMAPIVRHPALELFDLPRQPEARPPSPAMMASLERRGLDPRGLGHEEAKRLNGRLWSEQVAGPEARAYGVEGEQRRSNPGADHGDRWAGSGGPRYRADLGPVAGAEGAASAASAGPAQGSAAEVVRADLGPSMTKNAARWRALCERVGATWGERMRYELEMVTAVASEILDRSREAEDHVWAAAIEEVLGAPAPPVRSLPRLIAAALRRHVTAAVQLAPTIEAAAPEADTPYLRALARLLAGPCPPPAS